MPRKKMPQKDAADRQKSGESQYKTRNWVTVLYPDSVKDNWREILRGWCCQAFVSPLHDRDANPDGEQKKPHWHLLVMWDGPKGKSLMESRFAELGGVGCQPCNSARGYARYLCHLDNPEKAQYNPEQVEAFGGADYMEVIALESDRRKTIAEMMAWCLENGVTSFRLLCDYARQNNENWFRALTSNSTMIMYRYLRSLEHDLEEGTRVPHKTPEEVAESHRRAKARSEEAKRRAKAEEEKERQMLNKTSVPADKSNEAEHIPLTRGADWDPLKDQLGGTLQEIFG